MIDSSRDNSKDSVLEPRLLIIDDGLRDTLTRLRAHDGVAGHTEVDLDQLHSVQELFAIRLADDLLATFAAAVPALIERYDWTLSMTVGHTGSLQTRGARGDLVAIGYDKGADLYYCVEKSPAPTTTLFIYEPERRTMTRTPLADWLGQLEPIAATAKATPTEFKPSLVREMPGSLSGKRARHKKFGEGRVLREIGTGPTAKVQVAFPNIGMKMLQARFLEFIED